MLSVAWLWLCAWAAHVRSTVRSVWEWTTWHEVAVDGLLVLLLSANVVLLFFTDNMLAAVLLVMLNGALAVAFGAAQLVAARERWRNFVWHAERQGGAPRAVDVSCGTGHRHRFFYNGREWQELTAPRQRNR
jgi:hypothetical protein